jgi:hypothetical protein
MLVEQAQMSGLTGTIDAFEGDKKIHEASESKRKKKDEAPTNARDANTKRREGTRHLGQPFAHRLGTRVALATSARRKIFSTAMGSTSEQASGRQGLRLHWLPTPHPTFGHPLPTNERGRSRI